VILRRRVRLAGFGRKPRLWTDLAAIAAWDVVMVTLLEDHELDAISRDGAEPPDPTQRCSGHTVILEYHFGKGEPVLPVELQGIQQGQGGTGRGTGRVVSTTRFHLNVAITSVVTPVPPVPPDNTM
jgi:hypothetical protein